MDWKEFTAKTVDEALTNAMLELGTTIENMEYEVLEKESAGFLGIFGKSAKIKARVRMTVQNTSKKFLTDVFRAMGIPVSVEAVYDKENETVEINIDGDEMGILIGKRGQTLDSLQYLVSLVINKNSESYIKVKLDTENYRERRKETLENLAKNIAYKVKRTRKPVALEPMNPYERRIIHSALQNDKYVETYSEGEEPYRKVVINIKKTAMDSKPYRKPSGNSKYGHGSQGNQSSHGNFGSQNGPSSHGSHGNFGSHSGNSGYGSGNSHGSAAGRTGSKAGYNANHGTTYKGYNKPFNTSNSGYSKDYSTDYKKDYEKYRESKESKEKKDQPAESV